MAKRNRLRNGRLKAQFGIDGAIMAGATLAAAAINAASTANAAKQQADAVTASAQTNADALTRQNENNNTLQEKSLAFTKEQNEINRDLQKDIQMNLQILAGQQNVNQMRDMARTQVKRGGSVRRKLRNSASLLQGREDKLPGITTPNKGKYLPIGYTRDGVLSVLEGPDHKEGGININVNGEPVINAEGDELMEVKYGHNIHNKPVIKDVRFLSKHKLPGTPFNPAKAVLSGVMTPDESFEYQELLKDVYGISDDGRRSSNSPVRRMATSGAAVAIPITPNLSLDFLAPVTTGVVAGTRQLKCGGRHKAAYGTWWDDYGGATINAGANLIGAAGNIIGNVIGNNIAGRGYDTAASILSNAYDRMSVPNISLADLRNANRTAHMMPALVAPIANANAQKAEVERTYNRRLSRINRGIRSAAAAHELANIAEVDRADAINKAQSEADRINLETRMQNAKSITESSKVNAQLEQEANARTTGDWLDWLKYDNTTRNSIIGGKANVLAGLATQKAGLQANTIQNIGNTISSALGAAASGFSRAHEARLKNESDIDMSLLTADAEDKYDFYLQHPNYKGFDAFANKYKDISESNPNYDVYKDWYNNLMKARANHYRRNSTNKLYQHGIQ